MNWLNSWLKIPTPLSPLLLEQPSFEDEERLHYFDELVQHLLCENRSRCLACRGCKKTLKGFHPDWINLRELPSMDDIRQALSQLRYQPFEAPLRVLSIPFFGTSSRNVQNACLKTLEEPSSHWVILLGCRSRETVLETVKSRSLFLSVQKSGEIKLSDEEESAFENISSADELKLASFLENKLKDRDSSKQILTRLMQVASSRGYPGHWRAFAPALEESIILLSRNLNPKTLWDRAWAVSKMDTLS